MTTVLLTSPPSIGTRSLVRSWLDSALADRLDETLVEVDCGPLRTPSSSFVDELVRIVIVERNAEKLTFLQASERTADLAHQSASARKISSRVEIEMAPRRRLQRLRG